MAVLPAELQKLQIVLVTGLVKLARSEQGRGYTSSGYIASSNWTYRTVP